MDAKAYLHNCKCLISKNFILLLLIQVCNQFGTTMDTQLFTMLGQNVGMTATAIALMATIYSVASMCARPFSGRLTDRFSVKFWLSAILILKIVTFLAQGFSPTGEVLMFTRALTGIVFCFATTAIVATTSLAVGREMMATGMGLINAIPGLVVSTAPVVGVAILQSYSPAMSYAVAAACSIPALVLVQFLDIKKPDAKPAKLADSAATEQPKKKFNINNYICIKALPVCLITYCIAALLFACSILVVPMSVENGFKNVAIFFSMYTLCKAIGGIAGGIFGDLLSVKKVIVPALILDAICCVLLANGTTEIAVGVAGVLFAIAYQGIMPVTKKAAAVMAPPQQRGAAISTNMLMIDIAGITGSLIPGLLNAAFGYSVTFYAMLVFPAIGFVLYFFVARQLDALDKEKR